MKFYSECKLLICDNDLFIAQGHNVVKLNISNIENAVFERRFQECFKKDDASDLLVEILRKVNDGGCYEIN